MAHTRKVDGTMMRWVVAACGLLAMAMAWQAMGQAVSSPKGFERASFEVLGPGAKVPAQRVEQEENQGTAPNKAGVQGIKVHGHWLIDVRNADGTLVEHRDFENSLVAGSGLATLSGDQILAALLSGNATPGGLAVAFISGPVGMAGIDASSFCNPTTNNVNFAPVPTGITCYGLVPLSTSAVGASNFTGKFFDQQAGLSNTVSFSPSVAIVLSGNFSVQSNGPLEVDAVQTYAGVCMEYPFSYRGAVGTDRFTGSAIPFQQSTIAPTVCNNTLSPNGELVEAGTLTSAIITPIKNLVAGQVITVTVTLSFS